MSRKRRKERRQTGVPKASATTAQPRKVQQPLLTALVGRTFVHPVFDYFLIGGGLSLMVVVIVLWHPSGARFISNDAIPYFILLSNSVHFAASTVRLYTKPGAYQSMPFVSLALPLVSLVLLTACMFQAGSLGPHLQSLYLTWSPYHYAAQAYGLAVMYCYRSGCLLSASSKNLLWWVSMLPFFHVFATAPAVGLHWLDFAGWLDHPSAIWTVQWVVRVMPFVTLGATLCLVWPVWRVEARPMPIISVLMLISNGIWWFVLPPLDGFLWATVFHGVQYIAIVIIFHVRDQLARSDNRHGAAYHVIWFYLVCLLLGYGLFNCFPRAYVYAGFGSVESVLLVVAAINVHHFIVDAYIWRLKKVDTNRRIIESGASVPA